MYYAPIEVNSSRYGNFYMDQFKHIVFAKQARIARITLNRPDAANGLDSLMASELRQAAKLCADDPEIKVVILTAGGRFFSAGGARGQRVSRASPISAQPQASCPDAHGSLRARRSPRRSAPGLAK